MPPVEAWEKVWIDGDAYPQDVHALINCTACHGGEAVADMETAHTGLVADPSADPETGCASCHPNIVPYAVDSLHYTLEGYDTALYARSSPEHYDALETMESYHCDSCHATCGDCHISQPNSVGGGLLEGHTFVSTPPMSRTCTACHGSRVKNEYYGLNEGYPGDVHFRQARMTCTDCHTGDEMHGMGAAADDQSRYDGAPSPGCESCHADDVGASSDVMAHQIHGTEILSCQACHSVAYTNCTNCHVDRTEEGTPYYSIEAHSVEFYLGRNYLRDSERPYRYVPVRHVPVDIDSFDAYGEDLLNNFLNRPTWAYATPHNIQRNTPQTESCLSCHGNDDIFLTLDKIDPAEQGGANLAVAVEQAPPLPAGGIDQYLNPTENLSLPQPAGPAREVEDDPSYWANVDKPAPTATPAPVEPEPTEAPAQPELTATQAEPEPTAVPEATGTAAPAATSDEEGSSDSSGGNPSYWAQLSQ